MNTMTFPGSPSGPRKDFPRPFYAVLALWAAVSLWLGLAALAGHGDFKPVKSAPGLAYCLDNSRGHPCMDTDTEMDL